MSELYATGTWRPKEGHEDAFVEAWREFARWASEREGAGTITLSRDMRDRDRYVSLSAWDSFEQMRAWKDAPEFRGRMAKVQAHVAEFAPTELELVAVIRGQASVAGQ
jgi:heme-degrading monooxygenase HmoA